MGQPKEFYMIADIRSKRKEYLPRQNKVSKGGNIDTMETSCIAN